MAKIIAIIAVKGGVGKSSLSIDLSVEWHRRGLRVLLLDLDVQRRSAVHWRELAAEFEVAAPEVRALGRTLEAHEMLDETEAAERIERELMAVERDEMEGYDVVILDTPGHAGRVSLAALGFADLALIPCGPDGMEVRTMLINVAQVQSVRARVPELDAAIMIVRKQKGTVAAQTAHKSFEEIDAVDVLETELYARADYNKAHNAGHGVTTWGPTSDAATELRGLAFEISARIGLAMGPPARQRKRPKKRINGSLSGTMAPTVAAVRRG